MKYAEDIIVRPIITEKSYEAMADGKYTFEVAIDATKLEIKNAVESALILYCVVASFLAIAFTVIFWLIIKF